MRRAGLRLLLARLSEWRRWSRLALLRLAAAGHRLRGPGDWPVWQSKGDPGSPDSLESWLLRFDTPNLDVIAAMRGSPPEGGPVSLLVCLAEADPAVLHAVAESLDALIGLEWQALLSCPGLAGAELREWLTLTLPGRASWHPVDAWNGAGPLVVLLPGARPRPHGVRVLLDALHSDPDVDLVYGDDMRRGVSGPIKGFWFKPDWSPLLAQQGMLPGPLFALRSLDDPGAVALPTAALACARGMTSARVRHLAHVLCWTDADPWPPAGLMLATRDAVADLPDHGMWDELRISILIPTRDRWDLLSVCLDSIRSSHWPSDRLEIIVIDNGSSERATLDGLAAATAAGNLRVLRDDGDFNYARLNNQAAAVASGELLILLNNDTEVCDPGWLVQLAHAAMAAGVGAAGPKLLYPDGTVQHAGLVTGLRKLAVHVHVGLSSEAPGYQGLACSSHDVSVLTGACLAVRRATYLAAGGLDERLPVTFNDVAFCLRLRELGLRNVYLANPLLIHHESKSRGLRMSALQRQQALAAAQLVWHEFRRQMAADDCYSPCLSLEREYLPAFLPRRQPEWSRYLPPQRKVLLLADFDTTNRTPGDTLNVQLGSLAAAGFAVIAGGLRRPRLSDVPLHASLALPDARSAATAALELGVCAVLVHSVPFYTVAWHLGLAVPVVGYDHGSVSPTARFADLVEAERLQTLAMCSEVLPAAQAASGALPESLLDPAAPSPSGRADAANAGRTSVYLQHW